MFKLEEFKAQALLKTREELLSILKSQDEELFEQVERIEWVFKNKLSHLNWSDGSPILERNLTKEELVDLLDPPFARDPELTRAGFTVDQQRQAFIAMDPVLWAKEYLGIKPRAYQILILRNKRTRKILRSGRRLGKTFVLAVKMLHYACTSKRSKTLIMAPMKAHVELIWKEVMSLIDDAPTSTIKDSITRAVKSPQFHVGFSNGSELSFFTTGMKSGGRADVARGQEAGLIVLDEFDYMAPDDLEALMAMLQNTTSKNYVPKELIGASTPTGRKEKFYEWSHSARYKEFYYPSYCNPEWTDEIEEEMREEYLPMPYRHEIEADWGEDTEGVYPRKNVDIAFITPDWEYNKYRQTWNSEYIIGVDWDKYGAGTNIVVLELCKNNYEGDERFRNKVRVVFREETPKEEFSLIASTNRILELNELMRPSYIYLDRGYGDVQLEILKKHGIDNPHTGLKDKVVGIQFAETIEIRDPATKMLIKKEIKPYMVDNLYRMLEREEIVFPAHDEQLYMQLISYIVERFSTSGRPVFGASGSQVDHAHDALILACLGIAQHYGEFNVHYNHAREAIVVSNEAFLPMFSLSSNPDIREHEEDLIVDTFGSMNAGPILKKRALTAKIGKTISRRSF